MRKAILMSQPLFRTAAVLATLLAAPTVSAQGNKPTREAATDPTQGRTETSAPAGLGATISRVTFAMDGDVLGIVQNSQGIPAGGQGGAGQAVMDFLPSNPAAAQRVYAAHECVLQGRRDCGKDFALAQFDAPGALVRTSVLHQAVVTSYSSAFTKQGGQIYHLTLTYDSASSQ